MTIEIKQLIIRAVAEGPSQRASPAVGHEPRPLQTGAPAREPHPVDLAEQREAIVAACVREVMRKLERSRER